MMERFVLTSCHETANRGVLSNLLRLFIIVFLFWLMIYNPPIFGSISIAPLLSYAAWIYILLNQKNWHDFISLELAFGLLFAYLAFVSLLVGGNLNGSLTYILWLTEIVPVCWAFAIYFLRIHASITFILTVLIGSALFEAVLVYLSMMFEGLQHTFIHLMSLSNGNESFYQTWGFRTYGLASNLQYSAPLAMSVTALLAIVEWIQRKRFYYLLTAIVILPAAYVNARTSLALFLVGCFVISFAFRKKFGRMLKIVCIIVVAVFVMSAYVELAPISQQTIWLRDGLYDLLAFFGFDNRASISTFDYFVSSERYRLPAGFLSFLFGTGSTVITGGESGYYSDVGYINDFWLGGLVYCLLLYSLTFSFIWKACKALPCVGVDNTYRNALFGVLLTGILIANTKGLFFTVNNVSNMMILTTLCLSAVDGDCDGERSS